ncbi:MAG: TraB/GumN family protein [Deltaproteobacteria bacterium]|nr:TraB/GumN family protein [Deltaproteobacteria bacterium]
MKTIANAFLIIFLNAAGLSIAAALLGQRQGAALLEALSGFADGLAIFFGLLLYLGFAVNRHLPKRVLLPPLIFLAWSLLDFWPLENFVGERYHLYAAIFQLLLGLLALQLNLLRNQKSRLLVASQFAGPAFSGRNLWRFLLVNIPLLPLLILLLVFATASSLIAEQTAGFIHLKPNGLYMTEKSYQKDGKTIRLTSMIHLGQQDYYNELSNSVKGKRLLVLTEGVSDAEGRLRGKFSYNKIADLLGLASQKLQTFPGRPVTAESLTQPQDSEPGRADILRADIDLREFDDRTIKVLNAIGKYLLNNRSLSDGYREFSRWAGKNVTPETSRVVMNDLIQKRNAAVLGYLWQALRKYDTVVIPWGALHMPGIEAAVIARGFTLQQQQQRLSIDFLLLPYARLWANVTNR